MSHITSNGRLLAQVAWIFQYEAEAILGQYEWPPKQTTVSQRKEAYRLAAHATQLFALAAAAGQTATGTDYVFGGES